MGVMKRIGCAAAVMTFGLSIFIPAESQAALNPNFHIYSAYGQSNMEGNATNFTDVDKKEHPRVKMFATTSCTNLGRPTVGEMYPAIPPMFKCNAGLSVADWFGRHMADSLPDVTIGIIPVAQGGTSIRLFDPDDYKNYIASAADWLQSGVKAYGDDGNAMGRIIEVAKKAQQVGVIKGIIFHQGETDGGMSNWEQIVKKTYEYMLAQLNLKAEETPFVAGEMVDKGSCAGFSSRVRGLSKYIVNFDYASSAGYESKGDGLHFTVEGYRGMGLRYAQKMLKLATLAPVDPVPQEPFKGTASKVPGKVEVENFDKTGVGTDPNTGVSNKSFSDTDSENNGDSEYRSEDAPGVDLYNEGTGVALGMTQSGEWLEYTLDFEAGEYVIDVEAASGTTTSAFQLYLDDKKIGPEVAMEQTADNKWDVYKTVSVDAGTIAAGKHIFKLEITGDYVNIDFFNFRKKDDSSGNTAIGSAVNLDIATEGSFRLFNIFGQCVAQFRAKGMADAVKMVQSNENFRLGKGTYFVSHETSKGVNVQKVTVSE